MSNASVVLKSKGCMVFDWMMMGLCLHGDELIVFAYLCENIGKTIHVCELAMFANITESEVIAIITRLNLKQWCSINRDGDGVDDIISASMNLNQLSKALCDSGNVYKNFPEM